MRPPPPDPCWESGVALPPPPKKLDRGNYLMPFINNPLSRRNCGGGSASQGHPASLEVSPPASIPGLRVYLLQNGTQATRKRRAAVAVASDRHYQSPFAPGEKEGRGCCCLCSLEETCKCPLPKCCSSTGLFS